MTPWQRGTAMYSALYQVAAHGRFQAKLGRTCFRLREALEMAEELRGRGYVDAHAQVYDPRAPHPPYALTLVAKWAAT